MFDLFFSNNAGWFTAPAVVGTFFFVLRLVLLSTGALGDADSGDVADGGDVAGGEFDLDGDVELVDGGEHVDPGDAFKLLSVQTIAAFLMGFGWAGLGAYKGSEWPWHVSLLCAAVGGVGMVWLLTLLLKFIYSLQSSGNVDIRGALNAEGTVYVTVPAGGKRGQVRVVIDGRQRIFNAVSEGPAIESRRRVRVVRVNRDNTLTVRAI